MCLEEEGMFMEEEWFRDEMAPPPEADNPDLEDNPPETPCCGGWLLVRSK